MFVMLLVLFGRDRKCVRRRRNDRERITGFLRGVVFWSMEWRSFFCFLDIFGRCFMRGIRAGRLCWIVLQQWTSRTLAIQRTTRTIPTAVLSSWSVPHRRENIVHVVGDASSGREGGHPCRGGGWQEEGVNCFWCRTGGRVLLRGWSSSLHFPFPWVLVRRERRREAAIANRKLSILHRWMPVFIPATKQRGRSRMVFRMR